MKKHTNKAMTMLLLAAFISACSDAGDDTQSGGGNGGTTTTSASGSSAGGHGTGGDSSGGDSSGGNGAGGGSSTVHAEVLVAFDPAAFELPEGLVIQRDKALVGMALTATIEAVSLTDGSRTTVGALPTPRPNAGFLTGVTSTPNGEIRAALASFTPMPTAGVYALSGQAAQLVATAPEMVFPNGFAWGENGEMFVTDSAVGAIFKVDTNGDTALWLSDPQLAGDADACGGSPTGLAVGANGIVRVGDELWVGSGDQGLVARIPIEADGSAGTLALLAGPDCALAGIDGMALDEDGSLVAAINRADRLVRIDTAGQIETIYEGAPLDFPASVAFAGSGATRALYVTSFAAARFFGGMAAAPALVKLTLN